MNGSLPRRLLGGPLTKEATFGYGLLAVVIGGMIPLAVWLEREFAGLPGAAVMVAGGVLLLLAWADADDRLRLPVIWGPLAGLGAATVGVGFVGMSLIPGVDSHRRGQGARWVPVRRPGRVDGVGRAGRVVRGQDR